MNEQNQNASSRHPGCEQKTPEQLYRIGMFAAMNRVTVKALRFYEAQGLLMPARIDSENGYRYYVMSQSADVHKITALKQAGFTLEDIAKIGQGDDGSSFLLKKKAELLNRIAQMTSQLAVIDGYLAGKDVRLDAPVLVKTVPAVTVAAMQVKLESSDDLFDAMPRFGALMEEAGCECAAPEYCFTEYPEEEPDDSCTVLVCQSVTAAGKERNGLMFRTLPEIKAACIYHKGPYTELQSSYSAVLKYIEENGYTISGGIRESYIDGVWNKDSDSEWLT